MSRPKYYWYGIVKKMISMYPVLKQEDTPQAKALVKAYEKHIAENSERAFVIEQLLIKKKYQVEVANKVYYCDRTVRRWVSDFIVKVGKELGY